MKKKVLCSLLAIALVLALVFAGSWFLGHPLALKLNWELSLPVTALFQELYSADSGPSFHGDGIRYHVYSYRYEDPIALLRSWSKTEGTTVFGESYSREASAWLDRIQVPPQWRPDFQDISLNFWYTSKRDNSQIILFWSPEVNRLYIAESFL